MFANAAAGERRVFDDELHLFHADRLLGDWQPHPRNPVKSDVRSARPAGAPLQAQRRALPPGADLRAALRRRASRSTA